MNWIFGLLLLDRTKIHKIIICMKISKDKRKNMATVQKL